MSPIISLKTRTKETLIKLLLLLLLLLFNFMGNARLLLAPMFLLLPIIRDISDPPSQYLVNPPDP